MSRKHLYFPHQGLPGSKAGLGRVNLEDLLRCSHILKGFGRELSGVGSNA
jgi:hypothetical protein